MKFTFLFGGRKQAGFFQEGIEAYVGRISRFFAAEMLSGKKEGEISRFLKLLPKESYLIGLVERGERFTSERRLIMAAKKTTKKAKTKKTTIKKATAVRKMPAVKEPMTKTALFANIAETTELSKKDVASVFDALADIINGHIKKNAAGTFTLPGLLKVKTVRKPATKKRKGINPFTGEETIFKAKPARTVVKVLPLKKMKDMTG